MTVLDVYNAALALLSIRQGSDSVYSPFKLPFINQLLINLFETNNTLLVCEGIPALTEIPTVLYDSDAIPYETPLVKEVMPYGLAALLISDDDRDKFGWLISEFETREQKYKKVGQNVISDYYG